MVRSIKIAALALACSAYCPFAVAGVYGDDLTKCLVKATGPADQELFIKWVFSAMALAPQVQPYSTITAAQRDDLNHQAANLVMRLETVDCRNEAVAALKYEGANSFEASFTVLGQVAMRGLLTDPAVAKGMSSFSTDLDRDKLMQLYTDAGAPAQEPPKQ